MARSRFGGFALLVALSLAGLGCKQSVGGRCVQGSDCSSGICSSYGESAAGGHCVANTPTTQSDASTHVEAGVPGDAAADSGPDGAADARNDALPRGDARPTVDATARDLRAVDATPDLGLDR